MRVEYADTIIAESTSAIRLLETSHPPTWYLPPQDVRTELLRPAPGRSRCEWKGAASYWDLAVGDRVCAQAAWSYSTPGSHFTAIAGFVAFYPGRVDVCYVDGERVRAQPGEFYGGWVTDDVSGPFKGEAGTLGW